MQENKVVAVRQITEGMGANVLRVMPVPGLRNFDPIVLFDHFNLKAGTGFPNHAHRGFEAISYILHGQLQHTDNLGNRAIIGRGQVQRFTAGKGIIHAETAVGSHPCCGIQIWINLPHRLKSVTADYQRVSAAELPRQWQGEALVRTLCGGESPVQLMTPALVQDISLPAQERLCYHVPEQHRGFIYVVSGDARVVTQSIRAQQAIFIERQSSLEMLAETDSRLIIVLAQPHGEPIVQRNGNVD